MNDMKNEKDTTRPKNKFSSNFRFFWMYRCYT